MKILKMGESDRRNQGVGKGWIGKEVTCNECGCIMKLEDGDDDSILRELIPLPETPVYLTLYIISCPTCNGFILIP